MSEPRPPLPYDFLPKVPALHVSSLSVTDGKTLSNQHVFNGMGYAGDNISPHLQWSGVPEGTQSFAVTCFDPDAPTGSGFWHWVLFDLPANTTALAAGAGTNPFTELPPGAIHARNDYGTHDFGGAAPPEGHGPHRYLFTVHAVDVPTLGIGADASPAFVGFNLTFHALARGFILATYGK